MGIEIALSRTNQKQALVGGNQRDFVMTYVREH